MDYLSNLEEVLAPAPRLKIIIFLFLKEEANIMRISRETGLSYMAVSRHLNALLNKGIVGEKRFGRIRVFYLNYKNPLTIEIKKFLLSLSGRDGKVKV
ncbi:MAG: winged helix-turn-helix domain-containing protein [Candidatus Methanodesulfokora sp.]